jgi:hypothetical protein
MLKKLPSIFDTISIFGEAEKIMISLGQNSRVTTEFD